MTGKNAGGHAAQGEWEEKKRGAGGWPIHSQCRHGWILTEDTGLCNSYVLVIILTKRKHAKQMSLCLKEENLN